MSQYTEEQLKQIKTSLEQAKANPNDPKSKEIERRLRAGQLNYELEALGLKPVPIEKPKLKLNDYGINSVSSQLKGEAPKEVDFTNIPEKESEESRFVRMVKDIPSDLQETSANLEKSADDSISYLKDVYGKTSFGGEGDDYTLAQAFLATTGQVAKTGVTIMDEMITGTGKIFLTDKAEKKLGETVKNAMEGTNIEKSIKDLMTWYEGLDQDDKLIVDAAKPIAEMIGEFLVIGKTAKPLQEGIQQGMDTAQDIAKKIPDVANKVEDATEKGFRFAADEVGARIDNYNNGKLPERLNRQQARVDDAMGKLTQAGADPDTIRAAQESLSQLDTTDIKTFADLNSKQRDRIEALANKQDEVLEAYSETITPDTAGRYNKVGDKTVVDTPVQDALDGLKTAYTKGGEVSKAAEIDQLIEKFNSEGLTLKEVNDLARRYNLEFRDRAFTKTGDPKTGYNAEAYENIRRGVKDVIDERTTEDSIFKSLDIEMAKVYQTLRATEKLEDQVAKKLQKLEKEGFFKKVGRGVGAAVDIATLGGVRAFLARILPRGYATSNTMSVLEIEKNLQKYLKELDRIEELKASNPKAAQEALNKMIDDYEPSIGLSIKDVSSRNASQAVGGKDLRVVKYTDSKGRKQSMEMDADEVREFTNRLDDKGIDYEIDTKPSGFKEGATPSQTTDDLLKGWTTIDIATERMPDFTPEQIKEFEKLDLPKGIEEPTYMYRAGEISSDRLTSWTPNKEVAEMHAEVRRDAGLSDGIVAKEIKPDQVLVSLTDLPPDMKKKYNVIEDEEEFILKPFK